MKTMNYIEKRLLALSHEWYPEEKDDVTLMIGMLLEEHRTFHDIRELMRRH